MRIAVTNAIFQSLLAERVGFEPTVRREPYNGFRDRPVQPLRHLSQQPASGQARRVYRIELAPDQRCCALDSHPYSDLHLALLRWPSSNGRTTGSGPVGRGSNPCGPAMLFTSRAQGEPGCLDSPPRPPDRIPLLPVAHRLMAGQPVLVRSVGVRIPVGQPQCGLLLKAPLMLSGGRLLL